MFSTAMKEAQKQRIKATQRKNADKNGGKPEAMKMMSLSSQVKPGG